MKRPLLAALAAAAAVLGFAAAFAVAAPPGKDKKQTNVTTTSTPGTTDTTTTSDSTTTSERHGKKPAKTGAACRPRVSVILRGTLAADGAAAPFALSMTVTGGNGAGRVYAAATQPTSVAVTAATRVSRRGDHNPADLKSGDRVVVQAVACKADLAGGATPPLTAKRVTANPPKSAKGSGDGGTTTTG